MAGVVAMQMDPATGAVRFEGAGVVLTPGMARGPAMDALESLEGKSPCFGGQPVSLLPYFSHGELTDIHFGVALPGAPMEDNWPTRAAIDAEIAFVRGELGRQLGRSFATGEAKFSWGEVWSLFDGKGFQATAGVRWAR